MKCRKAIDKTMAVVLSCAMVPLSVSGVAWAVDVLPQEADASEVASGAAAGSEAQQMQVADDDAPDAGGAALNGDASDNANADADAVADANDNANSNANADAAANENGNANADSDPSAHATVDASVFASGTGTAEDPYVISDAAQLSAFRDSTNDGNTYKGLYVTLSSDIDLGGVSWLPIGGAVRSGSGITGTSSAFEGTFDGAGHTITGLVVDSDFSPNYTLGLFGTVSGGTVENLNLQDVKVDSPASEIAGGAVGMVTDGGVVSNVTVSGSVSALCAAGGIVGRMTLTGTIAGCTNAAAVTTTGGSGNTGGIVGAAYYTTDAGKMTIADCTNEGAVTGTNDVGGIAGLNCAFISDCVNKGAVRGSSYALGGIAGECKNYGGIDGCTNDADVTYTGSATEDYGAGGIVGWVRYDGTAPAYGASETISVTGNVNHGAVSGSNDAGGIVGTLYNAGIVTGNESTAAAVGANGFAGGIVGNIQNDETVPSTVDKVMTVENNVSTTPVSEITAAHTDQYAYNNTGSAATVKDNGTAWNAEIGAVRYVSVPDAVETAEDGQTVTLLNDVEDQPEIDKTGASTVTLDLNGHTLAFADDGDFLVQDGTLVIAGSGAVQTQADPNDADEDLDPIVVKAASATDDAAALLEGGAYDADVSAYAADGYSELVLDRTQPDGKYLILQTPEAKDRAAAQIEKDGRTVYYESADAARAAAAADPDAVLTVYGEESGNSNANDNSNDDNTNGNSDTDDNTNTGGNSNEDDNANGNADDGNSNSDGSGHSDGDSNENDNGNADAGNENAGNANAGNVNADADNANGAASNLNETVRTTVTIDDARAATVIPKTGDEATLPLTALATATFAAGAAAIAFLRRRAR